MDIKTPLTIFTAELEQIIASDKNANNISEKTLEKAIQLLQGYATAVSIKALSIPDFSQILRHADNRLQEVSDKKTSFFCKAVSDVLPKEDLIAISQVISLEDFVTYVAHMTKIGKIGFLFRESKLGETLTSMLFNDKKNKEFSNQFMQQLMLPILKLIAKDLAITDILKKHNEEEVQKLTEDELKAIDEEVQLLNKDQKLNDKKIEKLKEEKIQFIKEKKLKVFLQKELNTGTHQNNNFDFHESTISLLKKTIIELYFKPLTYFHAHNEVIPGPMKEAAYTVHHVLSQAIRDGHDFMLNVNFSEAEVTKPTKDMAVNRFLAALTGMYLNWGLLAFAYNLWRDSLTKKKVIERIDKAEFPAEVQIELNTQLINELETLKDANGVLLTADMLDRLKRDHFPDGLKNQTEIAKYCLQPENITTYPALARYFVNWQSILKDNQNLETMLAEIRTAINLVRSPISNYCLNEIDAICILTELKKLAETHKELKLDINRNTNPIEYINAIKENSETAQLIKTIINNILIELVYPELMHFTTQRPDILTVNEFAQIYQSEDSMLAASKNEKLTNYLNSKEYKGDLKYFEKYFYTYDKIIQFLNKTPIPITENREQLIVNLYDEAKANYPDILKLYGKMPHTYSIKNLQNKSDIKIVINHTKSQLGALSKVNKLLPALYSERIRTLISQVKEGTIDSKTLDKNLQEILTYICCFTKNTSLMTLIPELCQEILNQMEKLPGSQKDMSLMATLSYYATAFPGKNFSGLNRILTIAETHFDDFKSAFEKFDVKPSVLSQIIYKSHKEIYDAIVSLFLTKGKKNITLTPPEKRNNPNGLFTPKVKRSKEEDQNYSRTYSNS